MGLEPSILDGFGCLGAQNEATVESITVNKTTDGSTALVAAI